MKPLLVAEHKQTAQLILALVQREVAHLAYTHGTLFQQNIDQTWVVSLPEHPERSEKIEAFVSRFARLQDHIGEKLLPVFAKLYGERTKSMIDTLAFAERMGWVESSEQFIALRRLRNQLVHEYMFDASMFLDALLTARDGVKTLQAIVDAVAQSTHFS
jgi:hypothetical protein